MKNLKIEILCTGDEILTGKTINTNHSHIARRLVETGFQVFWSTIVGDDRDSLISAFELASHRADAVIVNGGLGPTVDDLSQEMAAQAAGVPLELHVQWQQRIESWYRARGRKMPENNNKQAMLPKGSEFIDNPIGTACGFALDINGARFFFTPGVPKELKLMLEQQILPRLQVLRGYELYTRVKRFHTFGIGESRADQLLDGLENLVEDNAVKLGFQSHYPQLETKLTIHGDNESGLEQKLAPVEQALRNRLNNFIVSEDNDTIESLIVRALRRLSGTLSVFEMGTGGRLTNRLLEVSSEQNMIKPSFVCSNAAEITDWLGMEASVLNDHAVGCVQVAKALRQFSGSSHSLVVLAKYVEPGSDTEKYGDVDIAICDQHDVQIRQSRLPGSREWVRLGATEMGLDCLRRHLYQLPVYEKIDFEQH